MSAIIIPFPIDGKLVAVTGCRQILTNCHENIHRLKTYFTSQEYSIFEIIKEPQINQSNKYLKIRKMKAFKYLTIIALSLLVLSCESLYFDEEPTNNPEAIFEDLWNTFNTSYANFEERGIDWQEQYSIYRPQVNTGTTENELHGIFIEMLGKLNDTHVKFTAPNRKVFQANIYYETKLEDELFNLDLIKNSYLTNLKEYQDGGLVTGWIGNTAYAYFLYISDNFFYMDKILDEFKDADGLIIDLRHNGGGDLTYAFSEIGRLTNEVRFTHRSKTINGPTNKDFSEWFEWNINPEGQYFDKPLVLITDRYTVSAAERATMAFKTLPNLVHVGDTTNGAQSTMIGRELMNGWYYTICPQKIEWKDGKSYEGIGLPPDIYVKNTLSEMAGGQDKTLETALANFK